MGTFFNDPAIWTPYIPAATVVGGFAAGIGLLVGGISLLLIWIQTGRGTQAAREATAFEAQKEYILLCLEHPELASSFSMSKHLMVPDFGRIMTDITLEGERALWFLSYALYAMEQLLQAKAPGDRAWVSTVEAQLSYHRSLLAVVWPEWKQMYQSDLDEVVERVLAGQCTLPSFDIGEPYISPSGD